MGTTKKKGIDISKWQTQRGKIDFSQVKSSGNDFVIIRAGWAGYAGEIHYDPHLDTVIRDAAATGLHVGLYVYSYNLNETSARITAREMVQFAQRYPGLIDYPLAFDAEETGDRCLINQGKSKLTDTVLAFCQEIKQLGYYPMWYTYSAFVQQYLDYDRLKDYDFWQADYRATRADYDCGIWQYIGDAGRCPGVVGACDNNYGYADYAALIRSQGWNGFQAADKPQDNPPPQEGESVPASLYNALKAENTALQNRYEEVWKKYDALSAGIKGLAGKL